MRSLIDGAASVEAAGKGSSDNRDERPAAAISVTLVRSTMDAETVSIWAQA
jgi:hypothetical protein